uniref:glycosyltransferase 61 family protein n=1 Tax=Edaphosphingomonas laterariae TaxID=861865 RepID=UPI0015C69436|nr:glycosyltransferase family 61 protein [Sphingomonas laterariae]
MSRLPGVRRDILGDAVEQITLAPALERDAPPAYCLPGDLDRVVKVQEETNWDYELFRLKAGPCPHGATVAYRIPDVVMAHGALFSRRGYLALRKYDGPHVLTGPIEEIGEAMLCTSSVAERYFGHWLRDGLLYEELAATRGWSPIVTRRKPWLHEPGYRALLGREARAVERARIGQLWLVDDRGLNQSWAERLAALRSRLRAQARPGGPKRVFLTRGVTGSPRHLANEAQIAALLAARGFAILNPEKEKVADIVDMLANAEMTVFVEGSAHNHVLMAAPQGSVALAIQPPDRFNAHFKPFADAAGIGWGYVVADPVEQGFTLPPERLFQLIEQVEQAR